MARRPEIRSVGAGFVAQVQRRARLAGRSSWTRTLVARRLARDVYAAAEPWPLTRAEIESFREYGLSDQSIADAPFMEEDWGLVRRWL